MSKPIISSIARRRKLVSGSNVRYIKPVSVSSICPSKQTCGSNVRPAKTFGAINFHASKPEYGSNVRSRKPVSVGDVCPSKTISVSNAPSSNPGSVINVHSTKSVSASNICSGKPVCRNNVCLRNSVSAINIHPTKFVKVSDICSGKPVCRNNVRSSKPICRSNVCQSKPTNVNILPCKPVLTDHTYHVDSSILSQQLFFIFFLSILIFSVYYKFSIITMNIFTNLLLAIVILLSKLISLREFFIMFISQNSVFLCFSVNTYITFQSCRAMLLFTTSEFFLTNVICVFAILTIILNFSTSNVQTNCFKSISQKFGKILNSFAVIFLILVIWQFNSFCIPVFLSVIFTMVVTLVFILFIALIFNLYIKLTCIIGIFIIFFPYYS